MRFKSIEFKDHRMFGTARIDFSKGMTVITGNNGAGKTALFKILLNSLFGEDEHFTVAKEGMDDAHPDYIFQNEETIRSINTGELLLEMAMKGKAGEFAKAFLQEFKGLYPKYATYNRYFQDSHSTHYSIEGEYLLSFAALLAIRRTEKTKEPLVLDCCFEKLKPELRKTVVSALSHHKVQLIIFQLQPAGADYALRKDSKQRTRIVRLKLSERKQ
ncbi:MAG: ATP-binding protein [Candidatus Woesearchaeota archaeon]